MPRYVRVLLGYTSPGSRPDLADGRAVCDARARRRHRRSLAGVEPVVGQARADRPARKTPLLSRWQFWPIGINLAFYTLTVLNGMLGRARPGGFRRDPRLQRAAAAVVRAQRAGRLPVRAPVSAGRGRPRRTRSGCRIHRRRDCTPSPRPSCSMRLWGRAISPAHSGRPSPRCTSGGRRGPAAGGTTRVLAALFLSCRPTPS